MFADGAFTGETPFATPLPNLVSGPVEIFKRSDHAAGFRRPPPPMGGRKTLVWLITTTVLPRISTTLASAKASLLIASVQLSMRRVA